MVSGYVNGHLKRIDAESLVDRLLDTDMRLPVEDGRGLFAWAYREGLLPPL